MVKKEIIVNSENQKILLFRMKRKYKLKNISTEKITKIQACGELRTVLTKTVLNSEV